MSHRAHKAWHQPHHIPIPPLFPPPPPLPPPPFPLQHPKLRQTYQSGIMVSQLVHSALLPRESFGECLKIYHGKKGSHNFFIKRVEEKCETWPIPKREAPKKRNCPKQNSCKISKPYSIETVEFQQFHFPRSKYQFFTKLAVGEAMAKSLLHWTPGLKVRIRDLVAGSFCSSHSSSHH